MMLRVQQKRDFLLSSMTAMTRNFISFSLLSYGVAARTVNSPTVQRKDAKGRAEFWC
jgi:hypothetical protein